MTISNVGTIITVSGSCTISDARNMRDNLISFTEMFSHIELDLAGVTEVDYPFIQLLHLVHQKMIAMNKVLTILSLSESIKTVVKKTGFCTKEQCDELLDKCQIHKMVYWGLDKKLNS